MDPRLGSMPLSDHMRHQDNRQKEIFMMQAKNERMLKTIETKQNNLDERISKIENNLTCLHEDVKYLINMLQHTQTETMKNK